MMFAGLLWQWRQLWWQKQKGIVTLNVTACIGVSGSAAADTWHVGNVGRPFPRGTTGYFLISGPWPFWCTCTHFVSRPSGQAPESKMAATLISASSCAWTGILSPVACSYFIATRLAVGLWPFSRVCQIWLTAAIYAGSCRHWQVGPAESEIATSSVGFAVHASPFSEERRRVCQMSWISEVIILHLVQQSFQVTLSLHSKIIFGSFCVWWHAHLHLPPPHKWCIACKLWTYALALFTGFWYFSRPTAPGHTPALAMSLAQNFSAHQHHSSLGKGLFGQIPGDKMSGGC